MESPKILAPRGQKQIAQSTSAERGSQITMGVFINAMGHTIPPIYIYPDSMNTRKLNPIITDPIMLRKSILGAPDGRMACFSKKGWMTNEAFGNVLEHFKMFSQASCDNPVVLLMDNHSSHCCYHAIKYAKENGINLLTFPPHLTNKIQPLDTNMYSPFKAALKIAEKDFIDMHRRPITLRDLPTISKNPYIAVFVPTKVEKSFRDTDLYPINRLAFKDILLKNNANDESNQAAAIDLNEVDDIIYEPEEIDIGKAPITIHINQQNEPVDDAQVCTPLSANISENLSSDRTEYPPSGDSLKHVLNGIRPLESPVPKKIVRKSRAKQSTHSTSTPELLKAKQKAEERAKKEKKLNTTVRKQLKFSKVKGQIHLRSASKSLQSNSVQSVDSSPKEIEIGEWIIVIFPENSSKIKNRKFLGMIKRVRKGRFSVNYVKPKVTRDYNGYMYEYPAVEDRNMIKFQQILKKVDKPINSKRGLLRFNINHNVLKG